MHVAQYTSSMRPRHLFCAPSFSTLKVCQIYFASRRFGQQPDMTFELFGPASNHHAHHQGCRHARAAAAEAAGMHGANLMAKHMASARFGSDGMLAAMLAIAQVPVFRHPVDRRAQKGTGILSPCIKSRTALDSSNLGRCLEHGLDCLLCYTRADRLLQAIWAG